MFLVLSAPKSKGAPRFAGCPTHRALCDVWVLAPTGMHRDHNQTRRKNPGPSVEEILPNPQVKWRIQRPHIRKERECVGHPAPFLAESPVQALLGRVADSSPVLA